MTNKPMKRWWAAELIADFPGRPAGSRWKQVVLSSDHDAAARALLDDLNCIKTDRDGLEGLLKDLANTFGCKTYTEAVKRAKQSRKEPA